jgi:HD-like signal output (HDOD) protein
MLEAQAVKPVKKEDLYTGKVNVFSLPAIFHMLMEMLESPSSTTDDIARLISQDEGLTARLLRLANSAYFGLPYKVGTVSQAINMLGTQQVNDLVLATSVMKMFKGIPRELVTMESFWQHSIACGLAARVLAAGLKISNVERFFVAGILHDVGRLVIYTRLIALSKEMLLHRETDAQLMYLIERETLGFDHADLGGDLLLEWRLPANLEDMTRNHHHPGSSSRFSTETAVIHVADILAHAMQLGTSGERYVPPLDPGAWDRIGLQPSQIFSLMVRIDGQFTDTVKALRIDVSGES